MSDAKIKQPWVTHAELEKMVGGTWTPSPHTHIHTDITDWGDWIDQAVKQASSPIFTTVKLSDLTDGYVPYHVSDALGLANSPISISGANVLFSGDAGVEKAGDAALYVKATAPGFHAVLSVDGTDGKAASVVHKIDGTVKWNTGIMEGFGLDYNMYDVVNDQLIWKVDAADHSTTFVGGIASDANIDLHDNDLVNVGILAFGAAVPAMTASGTDIYTSGGFGVDYAPSDGFTLDVDGDIRFSAGATDKIYTNANSLNYGYDNAADDATFRINWHGFEDGVTSFRDFWIDDGKGASIAKFDGSNKWVSFFGTQSWQITADTYFKLGTGGNNAVTMYAAAGDEIYLGANNTYQMRFHLTGDIISCNAVKFLINDTVNTKNTLGLTINQGANDDEIIGMKSSTCAHGITDLAETDTCGLLKQAGSGTGGIRLGGYATVVLATRIEGVATGDDTSKDTGAHAPVYLVAAKKSGTGPAAVGENGNIVVFANYTTTRFIFDAEGDMFYDGAAPANYQNHDDVKLIKELEDVCTGKIKKAKRKDIEAVQLGIVDEGGFISTKKKNMLLYGVIRQLNERIKILEAQLNN